MQVHLVLVGEIVRLQSDGLSRIVHTNEQRAAALVEKSRDGLQDRHLHPWVRLAGMEVDAESGLELDRSRLPLLEQNIEWHLLILDGHFVGLHEQVEAVTDDLCDQFAAFLEELAIVHVLPSVGQGMPVVHAPPVFLVEPSRQARHVF